MKTPCIITLFFPTLLFLSGCSMTGETTREMIGGIIVAIVLTTSPSPLSPPPDEEFTLLYNPEPVPPPPPDFPPPVYIDNTTHSSEPNPESHREIKLGRGPVNPNTTIIQKNDNTKETRDSGVQRNRR